MVHRLLCILLLFLLLPLSPMAAEQVSAEKQIERARQLSDEGQTAKSLLMLNDVIESVRSQRVIVRADSLLLLEAYHIAGIDYRNLGNNAQALKYYQEAIAIAKATASKRELGVLYNCIFAIYYVRGEYDRANDLLDMSLTISSELNDSASVCRILNNIGLVYYERGDYATALDYTARALGYTKTSDGKERSAIYTNRGEIYYSMGQLSEAETEGAKAINAQNGDSDGAFEIQPYLNYALVKAHLHKSADVNELLRFIYAKLPELSLPAQSNSLQQLAEINFVMGDTITGARDMIRYEQLSDSLKHIDANAQIQELLVAYDADRLRQNNESLTRSVRTRNLVLCIIAAFLVVTAVFIVALVRRMRIDKRKNALINQQREQIIRYERQEHERRQKELAGEVDHKTRQLTSYTIDLAAINEFLSKIDSSIKQICDEMSSRGDARHLAAMRDIRYSLQHYNDKTLSEDFRVYFDEVHPDFLKKLSDAYPSLSKNDLRICAYLHLGMSTKEIAALTYREIRSVESSRNRLRKKLGLSASESLQDFLKRFAQ